MLDCTKKAMSGLKPNWEQLLDASIANVKLLPGAETATVAWFLGDELMGEGIPLANLTAVARRIKQQWGFSTFVYTNGELSNFLTTSGQPASASEPCANSLRCAAGRGLPGGCCMSEVPPEIDFLSFDFYSGPLVDQHGRMRNSTSPFYCPEIAAEADCVGKFLRETVYPKLHQHQRVFVVPGLFGVNADASTDDALVRKFSKYWELATADKRIVGLNPWCAIFGGDRTNVTICNR
eukprot:SAG31_NODE_6630_length_1944_cov_2.072629_2_plen_236_part_00